jgi:hypothetical protein
VPRLALALSLLCLALGGCFGGGDTSEESPSGSAVATGRPPVLGVTAGALLDAPLRSEMRTMAASGVTTLRAPFYWSLAQPYAAMDDVPRADRDRFRSAGGRPTDFAQTDRLAAAASRVGIALLPTVFSTPGWAARNALQAGSPPAGPADYSRFMRVLIGRYGPGGSFWTEHPDVPKRPIRDWQIWNEPSHLFYWSDRPFAPGYVRLARAARTAIKGADPGARTVMAGFPDRSWESLAAVYRAGGKGAFDIVAIHPYTYEVRNVLRIVRYARRTLRRMGDGQRPIWLTEVTWSSGRRQGHTPFPFETTPRDQAARLAEALPQLLRTRHALGVQRIYWENWVSTDRNHGNPFNFSGLRVLRRDGTVEPKPAFAAYRRVALDFERHSGG